MRSIWVWLLLGALVVGGGVAVYKARGLRNNNPGNLRASDRYSWQGQVGVDADGFVIFDRWQAGMRALMINLRNQQNIHGLDTVADIITKYAPPSENDTAAYIGAVSNALGVTPGQRISLRDPAVLSAFAQAVTRHENGLMPYDLAAVDAVAAAA